MFAEGLILIEMFQTTIAGMTERYYDDFNFRNRQATSPVIFLF